MRTKQDTNTYEIGYGTHGNFHRVTLRNLESQQIILAECSCGEHLVCEHTQAALEELARDNDLSASQFYTAIAAYSYLADHSEIRTCSIDAVKMLGGTEANFILTTRAPIPKTGPGAFRPGDHVRSIGSQGDKNRRMFGVMEINEDGTLHLWAHRWGHIYNANPAKWERLLRTEEMAVNG